MSLENKRKSFMVIIYVMGLGLVSPTLFADSFKVKDCDATAAADITEANRFVANNLHAIFDTMAFLTSKQRTEMKDKWGKLTADCIDNSKKCVNKGRLLGRAHGGLGNQVNICYYNHVDLGDKLCDLAATMVHEEAHANGLPMMKEHNNPTTAVFNNDLIYRMESATKLFCETEAGAGRFINAALRGVSKREISMSCSKDDQCKTGKCEKDECVCKQDSDCSGKEKCKKPLGGINQCRP